MSNLFKIQNLEAPIGSKVNGFLEISERPSTLHKVPMTLINEASDGPTLLINGGEHGSEYNRPAGCLKLIDKLGPPQKSRVKSFSYRW